MHQKSYPLIAALAVALGVISQGVAAKVPAEEVAKLGKDLTCLGAERPGNADGSIPAYSGKWLGAPPHIKHAGPKTFWSDPYADEKPVVVITAQNMDQYADRLTDGLRALLKKYPETFKIPVYPSHRDWGFPQWLCDVSKDNAANAELVDDGLGVKGTAGTAPFPIPKSGLEMAWNIFMPMVVPREIGTFDQAVVYPNGNIAWGRNRNTVVVTKGDQKKHVSTVGGANSYSYSETLLPERDKGSLTYARVPFNYKKDFLDVWQYNPGTRRVRQLPNFGFDQPAGPGGFRTLDEEQVFNGSNERYDWKIVGKREVYVPYNGYRLIDPKVKYADLLKTKGHVNPDYTRFELHRVWVLEANLKQGYRHLYPKRIIYIDEDSWIPLMGDNYDARGQLWRVGFNNLVYAYEAQVMWPNVAVYHDLVSGAYMADRLFSEQEAPMLIDDGKYKEEQFSPDMLRGSGK